MKRFIFTAVFFIVFVGFYCAHANAASIKGDISFNGTVPPAQKLKMDADPSCMLQHPEGVTSEDLLVNADLRVKNVFVYIKEGDTGSHKAPKDPVVLNQLGCRYEPHVLGIQADQPLQIVNSDDTLHNVHALPKNSKQFNLGMPIKGMKLKKKFKKSEVMVKIKCDVHPWMSAYVGVLSHPYYDVTGDSGVFEIKDLAPGDYVVEAWHEKLGASTQNVTIPAADAVQEIHFTFEG